MPANPKLHLLYDYDANLPFPNRLRMRAIAFWQTITSSVGNYVRSSYLSTGLEIAAIGLWALWVGRSLLNFGPLLWPIGREFGIQIYGFHFWDQLWQCGVCSLWNGMFNGGFPFLADPFTGALHPISAVTGSLAGAVDGAKLTVIASLWMAGIGQWWLGKTIGLGRWSRLWVALAATSGGHIIGRMELGAVALALSTAASSLALAGAINLAIHPSRRAALGLAVVLALALLAGHGYLQIALLFWAPWLALIAWEQWKGPSSPWREFALAGILAVLMASVFLVPFLHVWPSLDKFIDPGFGTSQPFEYIPLNLVIHDWDYYLAGGLGSTPYPYLHTLYIGWPAVILAGVGLALSRPAERRLLASLSLGAITMFWLASGVPFRWTVNILPQVATVRHVALMAGLAVPAILAVAGYGLDRLLEPNRFVAKLPFGLNEPKTRVSFPLVYLLAIPLIAALVAADELDQHFLNPQLNTEAYQSIHALKTADLQWVTAPFGEYYWVEPGLAAGLKLTNVVSPFWWAGRELPSPLLEAIRNDPPADLTPVGHLAGIPIYLFPENTYAYVETASGIVPCSGQGIGGDLTVKCDSEGGTLVVRENAWSGWTATVNGEHAWIIQDNWLKVNVPPGPVVIRLRYLPIDALVGILLSLAGVASLILLWRRSSRELPSDNSPSK